ncbi:MAG: DUF3833 domain-containing protein [Azoarcus sp.]|nr:DUF3833 domain-containing protein [Azoarcus sp.]PKO54272.1 MAG: DUF3833 domain-containing protein [Betaproteobacteria bacterium HGW-Betaproteobacteria-21]
MIKKLFLLLSGLLSLAGCASIDAEKYRDQMPVLDLREYFNGTLDAHGIFQDRSGEVVKRFHVLIEASWKGDVGTLDEYFTYSDGSTQRRVWTLTRTGPDRYIGTADDVVGEALGESAGNALRWRYVMALPVDGKVYNVDFDDWMFLMDDKVMLNRSAMSKWGIHLGEVTLSFYKRSR